ncbi:MAG: ABC transporter substrate-binding protein [Cyanobium sp.]
MNRRYIIIGALLVASTSGALFFYTSTTANFEPKKRNNLVGAVLFLTGPQASLGKEVQRGIELAKEDVKDTHNINLAIEDSKDDPATAIAAINRLKVKNPDIYIITGDVVTLRSRPVLEQFKIPALATVAAGPGVTSGSKWIFRVFITAESQAKAIANYATRIGFKKIGILAVNNEFGSTMISTFKNIFDPSRSRIVASETYDVTEVSPRLQVAKILASKPEAIFVTGFGDGYAASIRQVREQGFKGEILSDAGLSVPYFRAVTGKASEGAVFAAPVFDETLSDSRALSFTRRYKERFRETPSYIAAYAYDAFQIASKAIAGTTNDPATVRKRLLAEKFEGLLNKTYKFADNGEANDFIVLKTIRNGQVKPLVD